jgi:hypothetical protein
VGLSVATWAVLFFYLSYNGSEVSIHGHIAMILGIFFSYGVGAGLMGLLFFSNQYGHDADVHHSAEDDAEKK